MLACLVVLAAGDGWTEDDLWAAEMKLDEMREAVIDQVGRVPMRRSQASAVLISSKFGERCIPLERAVRRRAVTYGDLLLDGHGGGCRCRGQQRV